MTRKPTYEELEQRVRDLERAESERFEAQQALRRIEWMLSNHRKPQSATTTGTPAYGDLVDLNRSRVILDAVGAPLLAEIVGDCLDLLDTSAAVYEKNGDYALGILSSGWCRFMDRSSRALCHTDDNRKALASGKWLCHESCWTRAALRAIQEDGPVDIACHGGIRLYALPVRCGDRIIGAVNFGYGDPPVDAERLQQLADRYGVSAAMLSRHARAYESRPPFIVELAKRRLAASARMIGEIVERKMAVEALRASEERFRLAFVTSPDSINLNRLEDGVYIDVNEGFTKLTGYSREAVLGTSSLDLNIWENPQDRKRLVEGLTERGYVENLEARFVSKDGRVMTGLMSARVLRIDGQDVILSITRDITQRTKMARQIQQAQKFEAIGTLAGGIAHDFNNLLTGIQGRASLMAFDIVPPHPHLEHLKAIDEYIRSATTLTKRLLGFARGGKYQVRPTDINAVVLGSADMFGRTKKEIRIHTRLADPAPVAATDRSQIEQVLLNLYINAGQAMPEGGELLLETTVVNLDESYCRPHQVKPGRYVKIAVTDSGIGMDGATRQKVFDPFFTTKEKGRGTGLGLASAYGIVKNHGGIITVYSEVGHGTTFNVYLPATDDRVNPEPATSRTVAGGSEAILLVDDESMILEVGKAMLEKLGYRVTAVDRGEAAINYVRDADVAPDLVILDMIMPGMDGGKTFQRIREIRPDMPVMLSSGYSLNGKANTIMQSGCNGFIQKPFDIAELSKKIRSILGAAKGRGDGPPT